MPVDMLPTPPPSPTIPTCAPEDRLGLLLAGHLRLETILGIGAYGVVYTARDVYTGREYAVKALNKVGLDARQRRFQQREIQLHHAASHHPNVVSLLRIMESEDATFVVMEYCHEGDLFASITEQMFYVGNDELIRKAFLQVLDAVRFCHSLGIYHRDLKPENVLCSDDGHTLKLADFGLATQDEYTSDYGCGSTFYMSSGRESRLISPTKSIAGTDVFRRVPNDFLGCAVPIRVCSQRRLGSGCHPGQPDLRPQSLEACFRGRPHVPCVPQGSPLPVHHSTHLRGVGEHPAPHLRLQSCHANWPGRAAETGGPLSVLRACTSAPGLPAVASTHGVRPCGAAAL